MLLTPALNADWVTAGRTYQQLALAGTAVPFQLVTVEEAVAALAAVSAGELAAFLEDRYLAFVKVHQLILSRLEMDHPRLVAVPNVFGPT